MDCNYKYFIELSFKGTNYHGWQKQPNAVTIQQLLESALSVYFHETIETVGAGRTDAGVHARIFFAHFFCKKQINKIQAIKSLNAILPEDIAINDIFPVIAEAHARFSAIKRTYKYTILKRKDPFLKDFGWFCHYRLDLVKMEMASKVLLNYSDFTSFCKLHSDVETNICKVYEAKWEDIEDKLIFTITADRFLRNMVRAIVGTLIEIGRNKLTVKEFENIILKKDRKSAGMSAFAQGLTLYNVEYPVNIRLPFVK